MISFLYAFQLPGRTDNEIKNFWNTRAKRHQRSGQPIYPPDVTFQDSDEGQDGQSTLQTEEVQHQDFFETDSLDIPEADMTEYEVRQQEFLNHFPMSSREISTTVSLDTFDLPPEEPLREQDQLSKISSPGLDGSITDPLPLSLGERHGIMATSSVGLDGSIASPLPSLSKKLCEPSAISIPADADPKVGGELSTIFSSLILSNYTPSSSKPIDGLTKLELPSFQCSEARGSLVNHALQVSSLHSSCDSSQSSGLLQAILCEANMLSSSQSQILGHATTSSNPKETEQEVSGNSNFPLSHGCTSVSNDHAIQIRYPDEQQSTENTISSNNSIVTVYNTSPKAGDLDYPWNEFLSQDEQSFSESIEDFFELGSFDVTGDAFLLDEVNHSEMTNRPEGSKVL